eukprot:1393986-Amorphochlora_amoeboformis.AAC.1
MSRKLFGGRHVVRLHIPPQLDNTPYDTKITYGTAERCRLGRASYPNVVKTERSEAKAGL